MAPQQSTTVLPHASLERRAMPTARRDEDEEGKTEDKVKDNDEDESLRLCRLSQKKVGRLGCARSKRNQTGTNSKQSGGDVTRSG